MSDASLVRRLTTILAIDVVAFSTMSARDEEHALALLSARMDQAGALVAHHRGRVFKLTGDGLLAEFASPVEAVRAALEIQEAMRSANATASADDQLNVRIGINLGDVVESGDDLMGDAVNVAVRLESIATTGGICIAASVHEQIQGKLMLGAEDIGEQHVKNIPRPIHAYRLVPGTGTPAAQMAAQRAAKAGPGSRRLAVAVAVAALMAVAAGGTWYLRDGRFLTGTDHSIPATAASSTEANLPAMGSTGPSAGSTTTSPAPSLPASAARAVPGPSGQPVPGPVLQTETTRRFAVDDVPFVQAARRPGLDRYQRAEDAKALALNIRGIFAFASRRLDEATARRIALEECNKLVEQHIARPRDVDRCQIYAVGQDVVWSFRPPAMPPAPFMPPALSPPVPFDPATAPLLTDNARRMLQEHYMKSDHDRAVVIGQRHFDWWMPGDTESEAAKRTLEICGHLTGRPCVVLAVNGRSAVRTPTTRRTIDVLVPAEVGGVAADQRDAIYRYLVEPDWRAVAVGSNGKTGIVSGRPSEQAATTDALAECARAGGLDCTVLAIGPFLVGSQ